ncbi:hypothetical protein NQZ68_036516 [Dissostichus eleginoides]|nr:hypothetical protein NQZ68_036516 [Dissostichus eleginoides]
MSVQDLDAREPTTLTRRNAENVSSRSAVHPVTIADPNTSPQNNRMATSGMHSIGESQGFKDTEPNNGLWIPISQDDSDPGHYSLPFGSF